MINKERARITCSSWHGGQWSALYQYASSGIYTIENHLRYLQEIETCLHPEYNLYPGELSKKDELSLNRLKQFFIKQGELNGITTEYERHNLYGYLIPFIGEGTSDELTNRVKCLYYME